MIFIHISSIHSSDSFAKRSETKVKSCHKSQMSSMAIKNNQSFKCSLIIGQTIYNKLYIQNLTVIQIEKLCKPLPLRETKIQTCRELNHGFLCDWQFKSDSILFFVPRENASFQTQFISNKVSNSTQLLDSNFAERCCSTQFKIRESNLNPFANLNRFVQERYNEPQN